MYNYIYDLLTGRILQVVCSPSFDLEGYRGHFTQQGYPEIAAISSDTNSQATYVDGGVLVSTLQTIED